MSDQRDKSTVPVAASDDLAALGARFKEVRRAHKVYLRPLAQAMDCSVNYIRWHEAGARMMRVDQLVAAARVIGVDPAELLPAPQQEGGAA